MEGLDLKGVFQTVSALAPKGTSTGALGESQGAQQVTFRNAEKSELFSRRIIVSDVTDLPIRGMLRFNDPVS
jgi:hypothetical protein